MDRSRSITYFQYRRLWESIYNNTCVHSMRVGAINPRSQSASASNRMNFSIGYLCGTKSLRKVISEKLKTHNSEPRRIEYKQIRLFAGFLFNYRASYQCLHWAGVQTRTRRPASGQSISWTLLDNSGIWA